MTYREARKLKPDKSYVSFAGQNFVFHRLVKNAGVWMVEIWDEPNHIDVLILSSVGRKLP